MLDIRLAHLNTLPDQDPKDPYEYEQNLVRAANDMFFKQQVAGQLRRLWNTLRRKNGLLTELAQVVKKGRMINSYSDGIQAVALDRIVGSESRSTDFDAEFYPVHLRSRERWSRMAVMMMLDRTLPAVDLIRIGDRYFVRDGHHRVSVCRALNRKFVDANVTVWQMQFSDAPAAQKTGLPVWPLRPERETQEGRLLDHEVTA